ncbi:M20 aminoacylase family protein [Methylovirgula sp. 4M-Z18]|uniref:M20 aminoacylase family protein n=1 Tax=Methylovirgula sp. 4M-Z18 TaxID=2293567 RepID=UPI000E2EDBFD|nr:M20 aminoacylase family protein [Methylovirgula sp. 4M-Z18]RFB79634.1 amidohydrolase [Methylovirgula sp. 4M-Z18]
MKDMDLNALHRDMTQWRRDLHTHPEFGFEETRTAAFVTEKLRAFGFDEIATGIGGTGIVATLRRGTGNRAIALRADMDALRIAEQSTLPYASQTPGVMHACGHDGHTAMLLGAAKMLHETGDFNGTIRFIFQPAEEWGKGAKAMLADGLLARFPFDEIYGLHNMPGMPIGRFETRAGPVMSAEDNFEITLHGLGGHAARPHATHEVLVAACALVVNLQTIVARRLDPTDIAVVSVTELITDGTRNALPGEARILGDARSFKRDVSAAIEAQMRRITQGIADAYGVAETVTYTHEFVPLINDAAATREALRAAETVVGKDRVAEMKEPIAASEDFAQFLAHVPGCFMFMGNGSESKPLHNSSYDFNDAGLIFGAQFFAEVARQRLSGR